MRRTLSWILAVLAALALTAGVALVFAERNVFDADGFADRTEQSLRSDAVTEEVARRLTDLAVSAQPDLIALRPLVQGAAEGVVRSAAFRSLARAAARDLHRSIFDADASTITLTVIDAGTLLEEALSQLRPDLARRIPDNLRIRLDGAAQRATVDALDVAERIRVLTLAALAAALLLAAGAWLAARRDGIVRVGFAVAAVGALSAVAFAVVPHILTANAGLRALADTWIDPLALWCASLAGCGLVLALATASMLRPIELRPLLRRAAETAAHTPERGWRRAARALAAVALGIVAIAEPLLVARAVTIAAGALLAILGTSELLRLVADPAAARRRAAARRDEEAGDEGAAGAGAAGSSSRPARVPAPVRVGALATLLIAGLAATAFAVGGDPDPVRVGRCNGSAALCDKRLDEVVFAGTHNSMSADGEPGWLFAAQDAGIPTQLREGVRALLIDTHYGFATRRGVATDLTDDSKSREKIAGEVGEDFVRTAERLRKRIGYEGGGTREVFLCHAFCEVGATRALEALEQVHQFLLAHPEEVLILSIEDDTAAADTAKVIERSGLIHEVYRGPAKPPWPTLRDMIERNERVLVLTETATTGPPWMHHQSDIVQETPFHFGTAAELEASTSCEPNRGGTAGSLLLVNHWVDTSPAPRKTIARVVNAPAFLGTRIERCRSERGLVPNIVAVDFYRQGDVVGTVRELN
jgi:hypothetical protein